MCEVAFGFRVLNKGRKRGLFFRDNINPKGEGFGCRSDKRLPPFLLSKILKALLKKEEPAALEGGFGLASTIESGLSLGKLVKFPTAGRLGGFTSFSYNLKISYKAGGIRNYQTRKIVILLVVNIGGITKREFGIN